MLPLDRRAELEGWIVASRRLQVRLGIALTLAMAGAFALMLHDGTLGKIAAAMVVVTAICAYWVTGSHILDWRHQLEALAQAQRKATRTTPSASTASPDQSR